MKVPPLNLSADINRVGMALPFSPDLLWRYPMSFPHTGPALPSSPLHDVKSQMPTNLAPDPRMWSREDVSNFLRWFEKEFELPSIDISKFCMNGKALCMLTKIDLADRAPGAGDILHNTLQFLLKDSPPIPQSPLTPHHPLLSPSPLMQNPVQTWPLVSSELHNLGHLLQQGGSVTLSPAPSEQSGGSPRHHESGVSAAFQQSNGSGMSNSDSEESLRDSSSPQRSPLPTNAAFSVHALASLKHLTEYQRAVTAAAAAHTSSLEEIHPPQPTQSVAPVAPTTDEPVEPGTNGRLLWDFLQQLLNDREQRYSRYISWKNHDTGVFKIVDPPGLARLWGIQKNHLSMNYDKMSRALRYYYRVNILRKVQGERHCYQFLRNPSELKSIKNISLLRGAPLSCSRNQEPVKTVAMEQEEGPTDLSMSSTINQYQTAKILNSSDQPQNLKLERHTEETVVKSEDYSTTDHYDNGSVTSYTTKSVSSKLIDALPEIGFGGGK